MHNLMSWGQGDLQLDDAYRVTLPAALLWHSPKLLMVNSVGCVLGILTLSASRSVRAWLARVMGVSLALVPVAVHGWRLREQAVHGCITRPDGVRLRLYCGVIGGTGAVAMFWYLPDAPPEVFALWMAGCCFLAASSAIFLHLVPIAWLLYAVPVMGVVVYLTARSALPATIPLTLAVAMMTAGLGWMLSANWKNFRTLFMLREEREMRLRIDARATQDRSEYLENFSHEIRNPLTIILGFASLLSKADHNLTPEHKDYLNNIVAAGEDMRVLLNDLLDIAVLEVDRCAIVPRLFKLREFLEDTMSLMSFQAREKNLSLNLFIASGTPHWVRADSYRLRQVLLNLLSNAIKFTAFGRIDIMVSWTAEANDTGVLHIQVADTGPGMPSLDDDHLFQRFSKFDITAAGNHEGAGLGLFISQNLIVKMGGGLRLKARERDYGSVFVITIPMNVVVAPTSDVVLGVDSEPAVKGVQILIADDMRLNRTLIRNILEAADYVVTEVPDGTKAVETCAKQKFDLIFMDIEMPGVDGVTAMRLLRQQCPHNVLTPVIAVTGFVQPHQLTALREAGIDDCLSKPLSQVHLLNMVRRWTHRPNLGSLAVC